MSQLRYGGQLWYYFAVTVERSFQISTYPAQMAIIATQSRERKING
jgi:hypothetical protein